MSSDATTSCSAEEEVILQLLQQLSVCKRELAICSANLVDLQPLSITETVSTTDRSPEQPPKKPSKEDPSTKGTTMTLSTVSSWEQELEKLKKAYRDLELVAEDRESRLAHLEHDRSSLMEHLQAARKECDAMQQKVDFQTEVSKRVAQHYCRLSASTSHFQTLYEQVEASMEDARHLFANMEHQVIGLEAYQLKVAEMIAKKREMLDDKERTLRATEGELHTLRSDLIAAKRSLDESSKLLEAERSLLREKSSQLSAQETETSKLAELLQQQSSIIAKDQETISTLSSEVKNLRESASTIKDLGEVEVSRNKTEEEICELHSQIAVLELRIDKSNAARSKSAAQSKQLVDSLIQERDSAFATLATAERRCDELEKENMDLRTLVTKKNPLSIQRTPTQARSGSVSSSMNSTPYSPYRSPHNLSTSSYGSVPSTASSQRSRISTTAQASRSDLNDSVMDVDDDSPSHPRVFGSRAFTPDQHQRSAMVVEEDSFNAQPFDLLGDASNELSQYRGLKCCREPSLGITIACTSCGLKSHAHCIDAQRAKPLRKNQKFICFDCEQLKSHSSKAPKTRLNLH